MERWRARSPVAGSSTRGRTRPNGSGAGWPFSSRILEPGEVVQTLSLGAGNTGRPYDLETDRRGAEFKFTEWRGGPESIRRNQLFNDLFNLVSRPTAKRRYLYVVGKARPMHFLEHGRALASVLSKDAATAVRFRAIYGDRFQTVREYFATVRDLVEIVDLADVVPGPGAEALEPSATLTGNR